MKSGTLALLVLLGCGDKDETNTDSDAPTDDSAAGEVDGDGDGSLASEDCDDADASAYPGAPEACDGVDNDCDGLVDDADDDVVDASTWYVDGDGDGAQGTAVEACVSPEGASAEAIDCDDADAALFPGAQEVCDGVDNDCDSLVDDDDDDRVGGTAYLADDDADGWGSRTVTACEPPEDAPTQGGDCNDADPDVNPEADEVCDGVDNDCDFLVDDDDDSLVEGSVFYVDGDGDGYGDPDLALEGCASGAGVVENAEDCDDGDAAVSPAEAEVCDTVDNNCDAIVDEGCYTSITGTRQYQEGEGPRGRRGCETYFTLTGTASSPATCPECDFAFDTTNVYDTVNSSYIRCGFGRTADFTQTIGFDLDYYGYGYPAVWLEYTFYSTSYFYPLYYSYNTNGVNIDTSAGTADWAFGYLDYPQGDGTFYTYYIQGSVSFY